MKQRVVIHWFRRDLRLEDNLSLIAASKASYPVLPVFIFDPEILDELPSDDQRVTFIHQRLTTIDNQLKTVGAGVKVYHGNVHDTWEHILTEYEVKDVFYGEDYEPYAIQRDKTITRLLTLNNIPVHPIKDQVIFAKGDILKDDRTPYTVYTPYKNKWLSRFNADHHLPQPAPDLRRFVQTDCRIPLLHDLGFRQSAKPVRDFKLQHLQHYHAQRDYPATAGTSLLSPHLRFGTVNVRQIIHQAPKGNGTFLSELIWREFFMQILFHFPHVVQHNFKRQYDGIEWRNNEQELELWKQGMTGYPLVDAGMRELNSTGYMHNRVRMVVASFLVKHLLIDWRFGEAYFAEKLVDYDLSANNGNWQWAAGTGCDAAPYFRVFNPTEQQKKFDPEFEYIRKWVPEYGTVGYVAPMVDHKMARERAIAAYKDGLERMKLNAQLA